MNKLALPLIFILVGTSFVTYSFLDTFIIPKNVKDVDIDNNTAFSFAEISSVSPSISSTGKESSSSHSSNQDNNSSGLEQSSSEPNSSSSSFDSTNISTNEYYENLTPEQIASLFTDEVVFREREHYSDPDIYIDITTHRDEADTTYYYVADVRIKSLRYFKTALAKDKFGENIEEKPSEICKKKKGILAINGDYYGAQEAGYVLRNGVPLRNTVSISSGGLTARSNPEDLAIYGDGTFEIFNEKERTLEEIASKNAWQVFSFGPGLVKNGEIAISENYEVDSVVINGASNKCQRTAIGIISPLHYCFVVNDGRSTESTGFTLYEMATIMKNLHCYQAYNLDGGGSSVMYLDDGTGNANHLGHLVNKPNQNYYNAGSPNPQQRGISDIVYFGKE